MCRFLCLLLLMLAVPSASAQIDPKYRTDPDKPQSPRLPAPEGLQWIDQGEHDKRLAGYRVPKGFRLEIVADSPTLRNPVGLVFDDQGNPLVLERASSRVEDVHAITHPVRYRDGTSRKFVFLSTGKKDSIKRLTASKAGEPWTKATTVYQGMSLDAVTFHDGALYGMQQGSVRRWTASKQGGAFDTEKILLQGLASQTGGLRFGPDGRLYVAFGDGDHYVEGSDGVRINLLRTGGVLRCQPDGSKCEFFAVGLHLPRGTPAFDAAGSLFHIDADVPNAGRFTGCRLLHIPEGADFGWRRAHGSWISRPDPVRAVAWGDRPGTLPGLLKTGSGHPHGVIIYDDSRLPEEYRGLIYYADPMRQTIRAYKVQTIGAWYRAIEEFEFLTAKDSRFRPWQMEIGPDGALYVVDRRISSLMNPGTSENDQGRILRLRWTGTKDQPTIELRAPDSIEKITKLEDDKLIETLSSEEASLRDRARVELTKRGVRNRKALLTLLKNEKTPIVAHLAAMGALVTMYDAEVQKAFLAVLEDGYSETQRFAAEVLGRLAKQADTDVHNGLLKALSVEDRSVRRAVALAMARVAGPASGENLATTLSFDDGRDRVLREGLMLALEQLGSDGMNALISLANSGVQKDTDRVVEAFLGMRTRGGFELLPSILRHKHVSAAQQVELIESAGNYQLDPPVSLEAIVVFVTSREKPLDSHKVALLKVLALPGSRKADKAIRFVQDQLAEKNEMIRLAAIRSVGEMRLLRSASSLANRLKEKDISKEETLVILRALGNLETEQAGTSVKAFLDSKDDVVRATALRSYGQLSPEQAETPAKKWLTNGNAEIQSAAIEVLGQRPEGALELGRSLRKGGINAQMRPAVIEQLRKHATKNRDVAKLLGEILRQPAK